MRSLNNISKNSAINKLIRFLAVLMIGIMGFDYIKISFGDVIELSQWLVIFTILVSLLLLSVKLFRKETIIFVKYLDLLIPLFLMISISEFIRFRFVISKHLESINIYFSNGRLVLLPYSSQEIIGLTLLFFAKILFSAWLLRLIWQSITSKETNLFQALKTLHRDCLLFFIAYILNYGLILFVVILLSFLTINNYLYFIVISVFCFLLNLFTIYLPFTLFQSKKYIPFTIFRSLAMSWNKRKLLLFPVILQTLVLGICIGFPTNFFQLFSIDKSLLVESRFFLSINDLWLGGIPSSFQWYPTIMSLIDKDICLPLYLILVMLISIFSIIIKIRVFRVLYIYLLEN